MNRKLHFINLILRNICLVSSQTLTPQDTVHNVYAPNNLLLNWQLLVNWSGNKWGNFDSFTVLTDDNFIKR